MMDMLDKATQGHNRHYEGLGALPFEYHMGIQKTIELHPESKDYFKFCFCRNPWSRFLSSYREFRNHWHLPWSADVFRFDSFDLFCHAYKDLKIQEDIHFLPITDQISIDGRISMDYIARFEDYENEVKSTFEMINLPCPQLMHYRSTQGASYREMFDDETRKVVASFYEADIDNFKYTF